MGEIKYPKADEQPSPEQQALLDAVGDVALNAIADHFGGKIVNNFGPGGRWTDFLPNPSIPEDVSAVLEIANQALRASSISEAEARQFIIDSRKYFGLEA